MKRIKIIIEKAGDGSFSAFSAGEESIVGMGDTVESCKQDVLDCIETLKELNPKSRPDFLDQEYELIYQMDAVSLLSYYKGVINPTALSRLTGINPKQIHHYASGIRRPGVKTKRKIEAGLHKLGQELLTIEL